MLDTRTLGYPIQQAALYAGMDTWTLGYVSYTIQLGAVYYITPNLLGLPKTGVCFVLLGKLHALLRCLALY